ncbi:hypothetical protein ATG98_2168 [Marinobacter sp. LV10R520-4]|uniref:hypothetical protein n=1 Tax=Marinobacter sp. LV10R520-4 TaxID=1761796 RepID=UPI000BF9F2C4|nr:hypothetical protein [Marinobacter sp. LV10R520-4]PFG53087.1 hypothetical protein ATG98_2168 [Marinobacter sp. LV10R520-4]
MRKKNLRPLLALLLMVSISGCSSLFSRTHSIEYDTVEELVEQEFSKERFVSIILDGEINPFSTDEAKAPYETLKKYCELTNGGSFSQEEKGNVYHWNPENINEKTGIFTCLHSKDYWAVKIKARHLTGKTMVEGQKGFFISAKVIDAVQHGIKQINERAEAQRLALLEKSRYENMLTTYSDRSNTIKYKGQEVCSLDNRFGYVEEIANERIKILVKGQATRKNEGFFFYSYNGTVNYLVSKTNTLIWADKKDWAQCNFDV